MVLFHSGCVDLALLHSGNESPLFPVKGEESFELNKILSIVTQELLAWTSFYHSAIVPHLENETNSDFPINLWKWELDI